jgi:hypothetical protein
VFSSAWLPSSGSSRHFVRMRNEGHQEIGKTGGFDSTTAVFWERSHKEPENLTEKPGAAAGLPAHPGAPSKAIGEVHVAIPAWLANPDH